MGVEVKFLDAERIDVRRGEKEYGLVYLFLVTGFGEIKYLTDEILREELSQIPEETSRIVLGLSFPRGCHFNGSGRDDSHPATATVRVRLKVDRPSNIPTVPMSLKNPRLDPVLIGAAVLRAAERIRANTAEEILGLSAQECANRVVALAGINAKKQMDYDAKMKALHDEYQRVKESLLPDAWEAARKHYGAEIVERALTLKGKNDDFHVLFSS